MNIPNILDRGWEIQTKMKPASTRKTALILVDVQNGFLHPGRRGLSRSTPECEDNIARVLSGARAFNEMLRAARNTEEIPVLICHVHHHSTYPDSDLHPEIRFEVDGKSILSVDPQKFAAPLPGESVWVKNVNSGFIGTGLEAVLRANNVRQLIICGLTTDHCVSTTTRMANNLRVVDIWNENGEVVEEGDIVLVGDACAAYAKGGIDAETVHNVNLASLDGEFAKVAKTSDVVGEVFTI
ncbi:Isochorismatase-like protein [Xylariales sp. AK1849]|nr:Isochorismatase-like protein [Xylariales sp. AK1849]